MISLAIVKTTSTIWHKRLAHIRPDTLHYIGKREGIVIDNRNSIISQYKIYILTKMHKIVSCRPPIDSTTKLFKKVYFDLIGNEPQGFKGSKRIRYIIYKVTAWQYLYLLSNKG